MYNVTYKFENKKEYNKIIKLLNKRCFNPVNNAIMSFKQLKNIFKNTNIFYVTTEYNNCTGEFLYDILPDNYIENNKNLYKIIL